MPSCFLCNQEVTLVQSKPWMWRTAHAQHKSRNGSKPWTGIALFYRLVGRACLMTRIRESRHETRSALNLDVG